MLVAVRALHSKIIINPKSLEPDRTRRSEDHSDGYTIQRKKYDILLEGMMEEEFKKIYDRIPPHEYIMGVDRCVTIDSIGRETHHITFTIGVMSDYLEMRKTRAYVTPTGNFNSYKKDK